MIITIAGGLITSIRTIPNEIFTDSDWAEVHDYDVQGTNPDFLYEDKYGNYFGVYEVEIGD